MESAGRRQRQNPKIPASNNITAPKPTPATSGPIAPPPRRGILIRLHKSKSYNPLICLILVQTSFLKKPYEIPRYRLPQRGMGDEIEAIVRYRQDDERDDVGAGVVAFDPIVNDEADEDQVGY